VLRTSSAKRLNVLTNKITRGRIYTHIIPTRQLTKNRLSYANFAKEKGGRQAKPAFLHRSSLYEYFEQIKIYKSFNNMAAKCLHLGFLGMICIRYVIHFLFKSMSILLFYKFSYKKVTLPGWEACMARLF
jgi:hypothetical protein